MTSGTLRTARIVVPGILILLFSIPLFQEEFNLQQIVASLSMFQGLLYLVIVAFLGGLYYLLNIRYPLMSEFENRVNSNIRGQLLKPFENDPAIAESTKVLSRGRVLLDVFYRFIDTDDSLTERAQHVYLNGLFMSSLADVTALSLIFIVAYIVAYLALNRPHYLVMILVLSGLCAIALLLMPVLTKRHIELSNDQIRFILVHYKDDLHTKLRTLSEEQSK